MIEELGPGLRLLHNQRLQAVYAQWYELAGRHVDGSIVVEFERSRLELFSPGPGMCFVLDPDRFDPVEVLEYDGARLVWRKNPSPKLNSFVGLPLKSLDILEYREPLGLRFSFDTGPLCIFGDNDETHWCAADLPPWDCEWREVRVFLGAC